MMTEKNGKNFHELYEAQTVFQSIVTDLKVLPVDDIRWASYHMLALTEELGELTKSDKRWKTHRNTHYDPENKLEELADIIITAFNVSIFSGFDADTLFKTIKNKIVENDARLLANEKEK